MNFIGRKKEIEILLSYFSKKGRSLISIIGRRGVGKSRLNIEFKKKLKLLQEEKAIIVELKGNKNITKKQQINDCLQDLIYFFNDKNEKKQINDWHGFFRFFQEKIEDFYFQNKDKKIVVLIDEFAWLHNNASGFVDEFASFYDRLMDKNILFVITGSAISWMNKNVIKTNGGLHGKTHETISLKPFDLKETKKFLIEENPLLSDYEIIQYYFYTGGVARYLEKVKVNDSVENNIRNIYENGNNAQNSEFKEMFYSIFDSKKNIHENILYCFKKGNGLTKSEVEKKLKTLGFNFSHGSVVNAIDDLVVSNILSEKQNYGNDKERVFYLTDLFCYFYIKLFDGRTLNQSLINNEQIKGYAFEIMVHLNIELIKNLIGKSGFNSKNYSWKNKKAQIDLILDFGNYNFSLFEIKYNDLEIEIKKELTENILNKKNEFLNSINRAKKQMEIFIVSLNGTKNKDGRLFYKEIKILDLLNNE